MKEITALNLVSGGQNYNPRLDQTKLWNQLPN